MIKYHTKRQSNWLPFWLPCHFSVAMEKMDSMLSDTNAWQSQYNEMGKDIDDLKVPQCGESFITLVLTMTGTCYFIHDFIQFR